MMKESAVQAWCVSVIQLKIPGHSIMWKGIKRQIWAVSPTKIHVHAKRAFFGRLKMYLRLDGVARSQKGCAREIYWLTGSIPETAFGLLTYLSEVTLR
jgi:hypothetical protein